MPIYLIIAVVVLGGLLFAQVKHSGKLSAQRDQATKVANENAKVAKDEREARARADKIAADATAKWEQARKRFNESRKEIANAPPSDDGPLAPVLRRTLDGLRVEGAGAADISETAAVSGTVHLSGRTRPPAP